MIQNFSRIDVLTCLDMMFASRYTNENLNRKNTRDQNINTLGATILLIKHIQINIRVECINPILHKFNLKACKNKQFKR